MLVNTMTASYLKDLLNMMRKFKILYVTLQVEGDVTSLIEVGASSSGDSFVITLKEGYLERSVKESIKSTDKKEFIEKFKSSSMYMKKIKYEVKKEK